MNALSESVQSMTSDPLKLNWYALAAAVMSQKERSVNETLWYFELTIPYEVPNRQDLIKRIARSKEIVKAYHEGHDVKSMCKMFGVSYYTILNALHEAGIYLRKVKKER